MLWGMCSTISSGKCLLMLLENSGYPRDDRVRREARTLAAAGYRVTVIAPSAKGKAWHEMVDGVSVYRFPASPASTGFLGYLWEYGYSMVVIFAMSLFVFLREGFDVIHAHHPPDIFVFIPAFFKLFGMRYVLDHHDLAPELYYARFGGGGNVLVCRILIWLEKLSCRLADHVITTNQSYKAVEMQRGRVPQQRISIVRNGPDLNELRCTGADPALRKTGKTILGYVGVMGTQDGVDYLLRALHYLVYKLGRTDFFCVLVGSGNALPSLKCLTQELCLTDYVSFTGWVKDQADVARYISSMDICVASEPSDPYNDRSTAAKVMEYMALGKPTVAFDLPEHRFTAQEAAVYARPNDESDFAEQIALLMDDPYRRIKMGQEGRDRIEKELGWHHQAEALLKAYATLFTQKGAE